VPYPTCIRIRYGIRGWHDVSMQQRFSFKTYKLGTTTCLWHVMWVPLWVYGLQLQLEVEDKIIWKWNQLIEHSFWERTDDTKQTPFGRRMWKINANSSRGSSSRTRYNNNLELRGWPRHHACALCNGPLKTNHHLCLAYPFAQAVWSLVTSWEHFATLDVAQHAHFDTLAY